MLWSIISLKSVYFILCLPGDQTVRLNNLLLEPPLLQSKLITCPCHPGENTSDFLQRERGGRGDGFKIKLAVRTWQPSSGSWLVDSEEIRVKHQDLDLVNLNIKIDLYSLLCINHLGKRWILNTKFSDKFSIFFILIISEYKQLWAI